MQVIVRLRPPALLFLIPLEKELWEPTIEDLLSFPIASSIREIWSFDMLSHGQAAQVNARQLQNNPITSNVEFLPLACGVDRVRQHWLNWEKLWQTSSVNVCEAIRLLALGTRREVRQCTHLSMLHPQPHANIVQPTYSSIPRLHPLHLDHSRRNASHLSKNRKAQRSFCAKVPAEDQKDDLVKTEDVGEQRRSGQFPQKYRSVVILGSSCVRPVYCTPPSPVYRREETHFLQVERNSTSESP